MSAAANPRWETEEGLTPLGYALPATGPVPALTQRILELLRLRRGELVIDLCGGDGVSEPAFLEDVRRRDQLRGLPPFGERVARLLATSGVRVVQMDALAFGRFPMRYEKVLLRGGFARFRDRLRGRLERLFERLDPGARLLVVDSAPTADAPLFAAGLRRWEHEHSPSAAIADVLGTAGFTTELDAVSCVRDVPSADVRAWVRSRGWPILTSSSEAELRHGLSELRRRFGSRKRVAFTSRFELVLATKQPLAERASGHVASSSLSVPSRGAGPV